MRRRQCGLFIHQPVLEGLALPLRYCRICGAYPGLDDADPNAGLLKEDVRLVFWGVKGTYFVRIYLGSRTTAPIMDRPGKGTDEESA
jgi:hypothetical protein